MEKSDQVLKIVSVVLLEPRESETKLWYVPLTNLPKKIGNIKQQKNLVTYSILNSTRCVGFVSIRCFNY